MSSQSKTKKAPSGDRTPLLPSSRPSTPPPSTPASASAAPPRPPNPTIDPSAPLHTIPIALRPSSTSSRPSPAPLGAAQRVLFPALFLSALVGINGVQLVLLGPMSVLERGAGVLGAGRVGRAVGRVRGRWMRVTKGWFGCLLVAITVLFAPTSITLSSDGSVDLRRIVRPRGSNSSDLDKSQSDDEDKEGSDGEDETGDERARLTRSTSRDSGVDAVGGAHSVRAAGRAGKGASRAMEIDLPQRLVIMANHQAYTDWMYIWILGYLTSARGGGGEEKSNALGLRTDGRPRETKSQATQAGHGGRDIIILLKRSLKWIPIVGWGMQFYDFIFLNRSWAADRDNLTRALTRLGQAARAGSGLWLLIFPEGTITSDEERAKSVRYAQREGVADFVNCLHPRATGLLFALRTLLPEVPDLKVLDITIGYPGVPRGAYAQEWYNLTSVFTNGIPPPSIHLHLRMIDPVRDGVPGLDPVLPKQAPEAANPAPKVDADAPSVPAIGLATPDEAAAFNLWLRGRWADKDSMLDHFVQTGEFEHAGPGGTAVMPIVF